MQGVGQPLADFLNEEADPQDLSPTFIHLITIIMDKINKDKAQKEFDEWIEGQLEWLAEVHLGR